MASKRGGTESKALIISLVFAIILLLGVSIYLYMTISNQDQIQKDIAEKTNQSEQEKKKAEYYKYLALRLKSYTVDLKDDEKAALEKLHGTFKSNIVDPDYAELFKKFDAPDPAKPEESQVADGPLKDILPKDKENMHRNWGGNLAKVNATLTGEIKALREQVEKQQNQVAKLSKDNDSLAKDLASEKDSHQADKVGFADALKKQTESAAVTLKAEANRLAPIEKESAKAHEKANQAVADKDTAEKGRVAALAELDKIKKERDDILAVRKKEHDLLNAATASSDAERARYEQPRGEIFAVERSNHTAMLRLVSTRNLEVGQTLSVRGTNQQGKDLEENKGSLKVIEVIDGHYCRADINAKHPNSDPVMKGDKVYSLLWDPNRRVHVVLAGVMDSSAVNGDNDLTSGFSPAEAARSLAAFQRSLERQGIIIDGYLNLKSFKLEGKIAPGTDYVVIGGLPASAKIKTDTGGEVDLLKARDQLVDEAKRLGVPTISLRRFVGVSGLSIPTTTP